MRNEEIFKIYCKAEMVDLNNNITSYDTISAWIYLN